MDVVVTPAEFKPGTWTLSDRLGRPLGEIYQASKGQAIIHPIPTSILSGIRTAQYASLDEAMSAIAIYMKGECQLSNSAEKRRL
jgi:hypothetical protein